MTHTQGPWALDGDINAMNLDVVSGEGRIAMMDCDNFELPDAEVVANARLMRAAPDLLEALEYLLAQTIVMDEKYSIALSEGEQEAALLARAAISKARGES